MEHEEGDADRQRQPQQEIRRREADRVSRGRIDEQKFVFEERQQREIEDDSSRHPDRAVVEGQHQTEMGPEHGEEQQRQQRWLTRTIEHQARKHQQLDLEAA